MILNILFLIGGLILILVGANCLTDGSASVAKRWGISDLVIGLTIVALGTSSPELVVSIMSAFSGNSGMAIGNVVGSNIFNILMIVGVVAIVRPIKVQKSIMSNEIPLVVLSSLVLLFMSEDMLFDEASQNIVSRIDGLILLLFFAIFMRYIFSIAKNGEEAESEVKKMSVVKSVIFIVGGLCGLIFGGQLFVDGASGIARSLGASDALIGLTIVACGTSLPELATSVVAAIKGNSGIAIGNVIGSNLFNIFFVLGCSATICPLSLGGITLIDMLTMLGASVLFWIFGWFFKERTITRIEGVLMVLAFVAYTIYLIM